MTVSVLIPVYNAEPYLAAAIGALTEQTGADIELVIVDDGSTDRSAEIIERLASVDPRIRFLSRPNRGIAATRNELLALARGDYIAWADADDIRPLDGLLKQVEFLSAHDEFIAVCGGFSMISERGDLLSDLNSNKTSSEITMDLLNGEAGTTLCTYVIRAAVSKALSFRPWFQSAEDVDFQLRLAERGRIFHMSGSYYRYRLNGESITHTMPSVRREFFDRAAFQFAEQRRQSGSDDLDRGCPPNLPPNGPAPVESHYKHQSSILVGDAWARFAREEYGAGLHSLFRAILSTPGRIGIWRQLAIMLAKCAVAPLRYRR